MSKLKPTGPIFSMHGFTLLEVLVALVIVAIGLSAAIMQASQNTFNAAALRDKTFAHWIALNKVTELRLSKDWPAVGTSTGTELMAKQEWFWQAEVINTAEDANVRRVDVTVRSNKDSERPTAKVIGFLGKPYK